MPASKKWNKHYSIVQCIYFWNRAISISLQYVNEKNHYFAQYESVAQNSEKIINNIFSQLDLPNIDEIENKYQNSITSIISKGEGWKSNNLSSIKPSSTFSTVFNKSEQAFIDERINYSDYNKLKEYCIE